MTNLERLKQTIKGIDYQDSELDILLIENGLSADAEYNPESKTNQKNILKTALSILEEIANNPTLMRRYKTDDFTIIEFSDTLHKRIDALTARINSMANDDDIYEEGTKFSYMFKW